ncbi:MAG: hypothetical protein KAG61_07970 [Bacteriovoracaceae bacterium]|nr:hypothetical protein [Bacteriovoracaceae bacterium]
MALNLNTVKKNDEKNADFYKIEERADKKDSTVSPWQDFKVEEDLIDRIKSRDSVTKRIERKKFNKCSKSDKHNKSNQAAKEINSLTPQMTYTERMLNCKISERAKAIFSAIKP